MSLPAAADVVVMLAALYDPTNVRVLA